VKKCELTVAVKRAWNGLVAAGIVTVHRYGQGSYRSVSVEGLK